MRPITSGHVIRHSVKKVIIVTDGASLRAIRISNRRRGNALRFLYAEIPAINPPDRDGAASSNGLSSIAKKIGEIVTKENPLFWNLVAPDELLDPLQHELDHEAGQTLTRMVAANLVDSSLTTIASLFPPTPCPQ